MLKRGNRQAGFHGWLRIRGVKISLFLGMSVNPHLHLECFLNVRHRTGHIQHRTIRNVLP